MLILKVAHRWVSLRVGKSIVLEILSLVVVVICHIFLEYSIYFILIKFVNFGPLIVFYDPIDFKIERCFIILG